MFRRTEASFALVALVALVGLVAPMAPAATIAEAQDEPGGIRWSVRHAAGGFHRFGEPVPAVVALDNRSGRDTAVEVTAKVSGRTLGRRLELPAGAVKEFTFYIVPGDFSDIYEVGIEEINGPFEATHELTSEPLGGEVVTVGILGPEAMGWEAIEKDLDDGFDLRRGHLRPADLPSHAEGLKGFDLIVWPDPRPGELRPEQVRAVRRWVAEGGELAILVAERWLEASAGGLQPWTTLGVTAPVPAPRLPSVASAADFTAVPAFDPPLSVPRVTGGGVWLDEPGGAVARYEHRGLGRVTVMGFDPSRPELSGWAGWPSFWRSWLHGWRSADALAQLQAAPAISGPNEHLFQRLRTSASIKMPSVGWIMVLFLGYLLVIGPAEYFLLRRRRRLHWTWLTFPVLILAISSAGYFAAESAHDAEAAVRGVVLRDLWLDYDLLTEETFVSAFLTRQGIYGLEPHDAEALALPSREASAGWRQMALPVTGDLRLQQGPCRVGSRVARWSHLRGRFIGERRGDGAGARAAWREQPTDDARQFAGSVQLDLGVANEGVWLVVASKGRPLLVPLGAVPDGAARDFQATASALQLLRLQQPEGKEPTPVAEIVAAATARDVIRDTYGHDRRHGTRPDLVQGRDVDWGSWLREGGGVLLVAAADEPVPVRVDGMGVEEARGPVFYRIPLRNEGDTP